MYSSTHSIWWPRVSAAVLAAFAAGSAVYWGLKWPGSEPVAPAAVVAMADEALPSDPQVLARALGGGNAPAAAPAAPAVVNPASRMALVGVVANIQQGGTALIALDGKPARPYRVGAQVEEGLLLQSVGPRRALLAPSLQGPVSVTLELPALKK